MRRTYDVIVIGGGVIGCSTAYHLARKKMSVLVVDKKTLGSQASRVAPGMLAAQEEASEPGPFFDLCRESARLFAEVVPELEFRTGINPQWETCGIWRVAETEAEKGALLEKMRWQSEHGLPVEWHPGGRLAEIHPGLRSSVGGLYCPRDGQIDPVKWIEALVQASRPLGVDFLDHQPRVEIVTEGSRVRGVRTAFEPFSAPAVVVAAGAWSGVLLKGLGVHLPLDPVKGQIMALSGMPRAFAGPIYAGGGYLVPKADGRLIIGATSDRVGFDIYPTLAAQQTLAEWAAHWCPGLGTLTVLESQVGLRPATPDGLPVMGPVKEREGLFVSTGHYRNGILLSPLSGRLVADGVAEGVWSPLLQPFALERFAPAGAPA
jgi:glycine oxidase